MAQKRTRSENFSSVEKQLLIELISEQRCIVENKRTDAASSRQKELAWKSIAEKFWGKSGNTRSVESLKTCWDNIKKRAKKAMGDKIKIMKTGDGTVVLTEDPVIQKVKDILSISLDGSEKLYDCNLELMLPVKQVKEEEEERSADDDDSIQIMLDTQEGTQTSAKCQQALKIPKTVNLEPLTLNENEETTVLNPASSIFLLLTNSSSLVAASSAPGPTSSTPTSTSSVPIPTSSAAVPISSTTIPASLEAIPAISSAHIPSVAHTSTTPSSTASASSRWKRGRTPTTLLKPVAERLTEAKLRLTELAIEQAKEEQSMKKALFSVRCEYEKNMVEYSNTMLEIAKLELKKKKKLFEIEFKESAE